MAQNLADWGENAALDWLMGGASPTRPSARYLALHTAAPGESGAANEVGAGVGYSRQAVTFGAASGGAASNSNAPSFGPASGAGFGTVTHISIWDASSGGNCLWQGAMTASKAVAAGDALAFAIGEIDLALD